MDPWDWSVDDVVQNLCYDSQLWANRAHTKRPEISQFEQALRRESIDGATLLADIDLSVLKDDLGIKAFGERSSINYALELLRGRSSKYILHRATKLSTQRVIEDKSRTFSPMPTPPVPSLPKRESSPTPLSLADSPRGRPGEIVIEYQGKKRRKLQLQSQLQRPDPDLNPQLQRSDVHAFLGASKIALNSVFFGDRSIATESGNQSESDFEDIAIIATKEVSRGKKQFINRRMRCFFQSSPIEISASRTIRHPYPERLASGSRRTFLFNVKDGNVTVSQRDAVLLDNPLTMDANETGDWDYLAKKWKPELEDLDNESLSGSDDESYPGSLLSEIEAEKNEREERAKRQAHFLSREEVSKTITEYIKALEKKWDDEKLQKRQEKAWGIWRKASGHRQSCIESQRREIDHLDSRIEKLRSNICDDHWKTPEQIIAQCASLDVTVFEKRDKSWQVQVLGNSVAPPRPSRAPYVSRPKKKRVEPLEEEELLSSSDSEMDDFSPFEDIDNVQREASILECRDDIAKADHRHTSLDSSEDSVLGLVDDNNKETNEALTTDIIDLTYSSPSAGNQEELTTIMSDSGLNHQELESAKDEGYGDNPEDATDAEIERWTWEKLEEANDRKRIVMKLLHSMDPKPRYATERFFHPKRDAVLKDKVQLALAGLKRQQNVVKGLKESESISIFTIARIFICWNESSYRYFNDRVPDNSIISAQKVPNFNDFYAFVQTIVSVDETSDPDTPRKIGSRLVAKDQHAQHLRKTAQIRRDEGKEREQKLKQHLALNGVAENVNGVIINPAKNDSEDFIYINQHIAERLKPHQIDGVRFLWREIITVGDTAQQGCLLAHTMGLGKTMQTITLLVTIAEASTSPDPKTANQIPQNLRRPRTLVLCPASLIENWVDEFRAWIPPDVTNIGPVFDVSAQLSKAERVENIKSWYQTRGILIMGYDMFRRLLTNPVRKQSGKPTWTESEYEQMEKYLLSGPTFVIADEAHRLKNQTSEVAMKASRFTTTSRIALTGSPLANNLQDYYAMIEWVAPSYLGNLEEFRTYYQRPIEAGTYADSTKYDQRRSLKKLQVLKTDIDPKVHRADISVLQNDLKKKVEFVIKLPLTRLQAMAYTVFVQSLLHHTDVETSAARLMDWLSVLSLLCDHPAIFLAKVRERSKNKSIKQKSPQQELKDDDGAIDIDLAKLALPDTLTQRLEDIFGEEGQNKINDMSFAHKTAIVKQILIESKEVGDKVLIFSHWVTTLDYLEKAIRDSEDSTSQFTVARLDGKTPMGSRQSMIKTFNSGATDVFIISTRAGGLGLNITGANRVILMDFSWNPSWEEQAVGRVYRIGQAKEVFVYHLITGGTFEEKLHQITIFKRQLAARVVDKKNPNRAATKVNEMLFEPKEIEQEDLTLYKGMDRVFDRLLDTEAGRAIRAVETTETLHRESDDRLTEEELREVEEMIRDDRLRKADPDAWRLKAATDSGRMRFPVL